MNFKAQHWLFILIWGLVILGIVMITSVSVYESHTLMVKINGEQYCEENNCNGFYLWRHLRNILVAVPVFFVGYFMPIAFWRKLALPLFIVSIGLLLSLFVTSIGGEWGTARSWINIPFLPSIQPSEIAKVALIFYLAIWMERKEREIRTWGNGFVPFVILMIPLVFLIALQPDFGSLLVVTSIAAVMFFVSGGNLLHIILGGVAAIAVSLPVILSYPYIRERFMVFFNPGVDHEASYQVQQALMTAGSGRWFGQGVGGSGQRHGWLPEVQSDTIFAATAEEFGFLRIIIIVGAFAAISILGYSVAKNARNRFEMLVAAGVTGWITFQALLNMSVTLGMFPLTGVTLPFISYGGSSLMMLLFAAGVLLHIARFNHEHEHSYSRRGLGRPHFAGFRRSRRAFAKRAKL